MFCKYCGSELPDGTTFCLNCGKDDTPDITNETKQENTNEIQTETAPSTDKTKSDPKRDSLASKILTFAIMGLAFGVSFYLSFLGLIFAIISRSKLNKYIKIYTYTEGKATVGKHIGVAALVVSIVVTSIMLLSLAVYLLETFTQFALIAPPTL